jgi:hypothetical protein
MRKTTLATVKSFIRKNFAGDNLWIKPLTNSIMDEGTYSIKADFKKVLSINPENPHTQGIEGLWFVGVSGNYFNAYNDGTYEGYEVYNCCGSCLLVKKI